MNIENESAKLNNLANPVVLHVDESGGDPVLIFESGAGSEVQFRYAGETLWLTQAQMAELFGRDQASISRHINGIFNDGELEEQTSMQKVHKSVGRPVMAYNLDMIISVGYRVSSKQATIFRRWATDKLVQFATKGYVVDTERLKDAENFGRVKELREIIRDIRASESNIYREVREICKMCSDYDPSSDQSRQFFANIQNKLLWAVVQMTGPEIILGRANFSVPEMGLMNWSGDKPLKSDVTIAHNYLVQPEITAKNRLTIMLLDYFENRLDQGKLTTLDQAKTEVKRFIKFNEMPLLEGLGKRRRKDADKHAKQQYDVFAERRRALRQENPE